MTKTKSRSATGNTCKVCIRQQQKRFFHIYRKNATYPGEVRRCQRRIAEILDKYDYEGSMIYDEYPDKLQLCLMCRRAYEQVMKQEKWEKETYTPEQIREIVEILMYQELMERRGKGRRQQEKTVASCTGLVL